MEKLSWPAMWNWDPSIWIGVILFIGGYLLAIGPLRQRFKNSRQVNGRQIALFLAGSGVILFALVSPIDRISDNYLFSAHMIQHLLLALIAPILLLLGTPGWVVEVFIRPAWIRKLAVFFTTPLVTFALFNVIFLTWHLPKFYEAALQNENIHIVEHMMFIATGILNWWPILGPTVELPRLSPPAQILYLFLEGVPSTILGALIVFASSPLYTSYVVAPRIWGISAMVDQQIAGLVMGSLGGLVYLVAIGVVFFRWLEQEERDNQPELI